MAEIYLGKNKKYEIRDKHCGNFLTEKQKKFIIDNYETMDSKYLCEQIGINLKQLHGYTGNLKLKKEFIPTYDYYLNQKKSMPYYSYKDYVCKVVEPKIDILYKSAHGKYSVNSNYFSEINNEFKAYWLGFLYADGYNYEKKNTIEITLCKLDEGHIHKFLNSIQSDAVVKYKNVREHPQVRITICCKQISQDLKRLGCMQNKSAKITFPSQEILPEEFHRDFIRGYFDGDGCIYINTEAKHCTITFTTNKYMAEGIIDIIYNKLQIKKPNINIRKFPFCEFRYTGLTNCDKIYKYLYKNCNVYLDRKIEKFDTIFSLC